MGPRAAELMRRVSPDDLSSAGLKFSWTREIDLGLARVRAARMSYVGGPGFELYVPIEMARHVYLTLHEAGNDLGLLDAGYYAIDALRIEAGRRAWGAELGPDETPWEAGLAFAVKLDKPAAFIGRDALLAARERPLRKKLLSFVLERRVGVAWGGEAIVIDGASRSARSARRDGASTAGRLRRAGLCARRARRSACTPGRPVDDRPVGPGRGRDGRMPGIDLACRRR